MHAIVFVPAAIFCAVTAISCLVSELIEHRAALRRAAVPAVANSRTPLRLVVIDGGLAAPRRQPPLPAAQSRLRSRGTAQAARSA